MKLITRFLGAGASGLIVAAATSTAASSNCTSDRDGLPGGAGNAALVRVVPPEGEEPEVDAAGSDPVIQSDGFVENIAAARVALSAADGAESRAL